MEEKRKPGRPRTKPSFDQSKPFSIIRGSGTKHLKQNGALFTYGEMKGPFIESMMARAMNPTPEFIEWEQEYIDRQKLDKYHDMKAQVVSDHQKLERYESDLQKVGLLEKPSGTAN